MYRLFNVSPRGAPAASERIHDERVASAKPVPVALSICISLFAAAMLTIHPYDVHAKEGNEKRFGLWAVGSSESGLFALTMNDSGSSIGLYCYPNERKCLWLVGNDIDCKEGEKSPVLLNMEGESEGASVICLKRTGENRSVYAVANFDLLMTFVKRGSGKLSIAFPSHAGSFKVNRFDLTGGSESVSYMRQRLESLLNQNDRKERGREPRDENPSKSTDDQML
jgi:hypothetical protein